MVAWWTSLKLRGIQDSKESYIFGLFEGLVPFLSGIYGLSVVKKWSGSKSTIGRALFFMSVGVAFWGLGVLIYTYYNVFLRIPIPDYSLADVAFLPNITLMVTGVIFLARVTGALTQLRTTKGKIKALLIFVGTIIVYFYIGYVYPSAGIFNYSLGEFYIFILNTIYLLSDVVILTTGTLMFGLSARSLGGNFRIPVSVILLSFVLVFIADTFYMYQVNSGTYFVGAFSDILYVFAYFLLSFGILLFDPKFLLSNNSDNPD
jgi:hypothetical protein